MAFKNDFKCPECEWCVSCYTVEFNYCDYKIFREDEEYTPFQTFRDACLKRIKFNKTFNNIYDETDK